MCTLSWDVFCQFSLSHTFPRRLSRAFLRRLCCVYTYAEKNVLVPAFLLHCSIDSLAWFKEACFSWPWCSCCSPAWVTWRTETASRYASSTTVQYCKVLCVRGEFCVLSVRMYADCVCEFFAIVSYSGMRALRVSQ